jgi:hypothetical protein
VAIATKFAAPSAGADRIDGNNGVAAACRDMHEIRDGARQGVEADQDVMDVQLVSVSRDDMRIMSHVKYFIAYYVYSS